MSLERKGDGDEFDMVVRGKGRLEVHELRKFLKNRMFVITFHALESGRQKHAKPPVFDQDGKYSKTREILTYYSVSSERIELTRSHTISLEAFFTGIDQRNSTHLKPLHTPPFYVALICSVPCLPTTQR